MGTWGTPVRTLMVAAFLLAPLPTILPTMATAHHIMGIPHYRYGEDYPQIPYLEVLAQVGAHDLDFTYFPGVPKPGERVRFKLYIHDRESGEVFRNPLPVKVVRKRFLRSPVAIVAPFEIRTGDGPEKNDYKFFLTFDAAEAYEIRVHFPGDDGVEIIPFPVVIGETDDRPLLFGAAGLLGGAIISVAVVKKRRKTARIRQKRAALAGRHDSVAGGENT